MLNETEISQETRILKQHIQQAAAQLEQQALKPSDEGMGSLIYLGNHQDAIPRNLIIDPHLESGEIHTWALLKIHIDNPALPSSIPAQNALMKLLKCSRPVLSRNLQVLRALRWITLCAEVRGTDGQYRGNVYAQHDAPLSLQDTLYLDPRYIQFLEQPSTGSSLKRLRQIKDAVLRHMDYQVAKGLDWNRAPTRLSQISAQLKGWQPADPLDTPLACPEGATDPNRMTNLYPSMQEMSQEKPDFFLDAGTESDHVKNIDLVEPKESVHVKHLYMDNSSSSYIKTTTTTHDRLRFPKAIRAERLRLYAAKALGMLEDEKQQQFALDYLADRIRAGEQGTDKAVGNPIGFLNWIVRHIKEGTLPESAYGVRENRKENPPKLDAIDSKTKRKLEQQAWLKSLHERGYKIDSKTGIPVRSMNSTRN